jgi:hypothetical protein
LQHPLFPCGFRAYHRSSGNPLERQEKPVSQKLSEYAAKQILRDIPDGCMNLQCMRGPDGRLRPPIEVAIRIGPFTIPQLREMGVTVRLFDDFGEELGNERHAQLLLDNDAFDKQVSDEAAHQALHSQDAGIGRDAENPQ